MTAKEERKRLLERVRDCEEALDRWTEKKETKRSQCECPCHKESVAMLHFRPCCIPDSEVEPDAEGHRFDHDCG